VHFGAGSPGAGKTLVDAAEPQPTGLPERLGGNGIEDGVAQRRGIGRSSAARFCLGEGEGCRCQEGRRMRVTADIGQDPSHTPWRKSSYSGNGNNCVEIAAADGLIAVRDTTNRDDVTKIFTARTWQQFTGRVRRGEVQLPAPHAPSVSRLPAKGNA
jgi:hypothetical protein